MSTTDTWEYQGGELSYGFDNEVPCPADDWLVGRSAATILGEEVMAERHDEYRPKGHLPLMDDPAAFTADYTLNGDTYRAWAEEEGVAESLAEEFAHWQQGRIAYATFRPAQGDTEHATVALNLEDVTPEQARTLVETYF